MNYPGSVRLLLREHPAAERRRPAKTTSRFEDLKIGVSLMLGCWCLMLLPFAARAQTYSIDWFTIDGGGGTSTGGVYTVTGTIGQPDAGGAMTNGVYSLTGGFWALQTVQIPGAPFLRIALTSTNTVMVFWSSPSPGFSLRVTTDLGTPNWTTTPETVQDNGVIRYIIVNPPVGNRFYRLAPPPP